MAGTSFIGSDKGQIMQILREGLLGVMEERYLEKDNSEFLTKKGTVT